LFGGTQELNFPFDAHGSFLPIIIPVVLRNGR